MNALLLIAAQAQAMDFDSAAWTPVAERKGHHNRIAVHRADIDDLVCVQASTTTALPVSALLAVTNDMQSADVWSSAGLTVSRELTRHGDSFVLFQYLALPDWTLVADRYWIIDAQVESLPGGVGRYSWDRVPLGRHDGAREQASEISKRALEATVNAGEWVFTPEGDRTTVRYRNCANLGGRLPSGVQTWVTTQTVPSFVSELLVEAEARSGS